jgi:hypothetical protein
MMPLMWLKDRIKGLIEREKEDPLYKRYLYIG